jgi:hypothetical protein
MVTMGKLQPEERYVQELFSRHYGSLGAELRKIPESSEQTADFEVLLNGTREAVIEVKTIEETPRTAEYGWEPVPGGSGMMRSDKSSERVGRLIGKAARQLRNYIDPKVLVFVNEEWGMRKSALQDAFNGTVLVGDDKVGYINNSASKKVAAGSIRESKHAIDLYIWVDRVYQGGKTVRLLTTPPTEEYRDDAPQFLVTNEVGHQLAQRVFGMPPLPAQEVKYVKHMFEEFFKMHSED